MTDLRFDLMDWISSSYGDEENRATTGSLRITTGDGLPITEVEDTIARTVRSHVNVPLVAVAQWLLMNWWRLRWEGKPSKPATSWRSVHCLSGIGGDDAWPALELSSDGEFIQLHMEAEGKTDVSAIRYLRNVNIEVPVEKFEAAVERFVDVVETRLATVLPQYHQISELRAELAEERRSHRLARACRWQALAGINPGEASEAWLQAVDALVEEAGPRSGDEILGALPDFDGGLYQAEDVVGAMKKSSTAVDLTWITATSVPASREMPWERGARLAKEMRRRERLGTGPISDEVMSNLLSVAMPLPGQPMKDVPLSGGFRNGVANGRTRIVWPSARRESQRFFLARMIGAASVLSPDEHVVPVTNRNSALQKVERSFAQEFLCPWTALDAYSDEHGMDDDALLDAAEHFQVTELTVRSTLVNRGKLSRDRIQPMT